MKATELIKSLQDIVEREGDLEVCYYEIEISRAMKVRDVEVRPADPFQPEEAEEIGDRFIEMNW